MWFHILLKEGQRRQAHSGPSSQPGRRAKLGVQGGACQPQWVSRQVSEGHREQLATTPAQGPTHESRGSALSSISAQIRVRHTHSSFSVNTHVHMQSHLVTPQRGTPPATGHGHSVSPGTGAANNAPRRAPLIEAGSEQQGHLLD